jgi:hypothetical protein
LFILVVFVLLAIYWFVPFNTVSFRLKGNGNTNFSLSNSTNLEDMQFYPKMRLPYTNISYMIENCPLSKKNSMEYAFKIIQNKTILSFYPVSNNEEIFVTCDSSYKVDEQGAFIAGEGGPTKIIQTDDFNVILEGKILLIKEIECENPNVAIHELLHVLGFAHSSNPNNIMYNYSDCNQVIGQDTIKLIDELYAVPSYQDLAVKNVSAVMHGKYLDINVTVQNEGLVKSSKAKVNIDADGKTVSSFDVEELGVGEGKIVMLSNVMVLQLSVNQIEVYINSTSPELNTQNNIVLLGI